MNLLARILFAVLLNIPGTCMFSADMSPNADIRLRGTLVTPPPCTLNDGGKVDVDFGNKVGVNGVDGGHYRTPVNYAIHSEDDGHLSWGGR